jgi:hypothetical protein
MRRRFLAVALVLVSPFVHPCLLLAQVPTPAPIPAGSPQTIDDIWKDYRLHAGPLYVTPEIQLNELGVDTNVFNQAGEQKSDFTFTVTPQADVAIPLARRGLISATLGAGLVYYANYHSERSVDPRAMVRAEGYAHRLTLFIEGSYLNTRQRPNYEIDLRSRHVDTDLTGGLAVRFTPRFSLEVARRHAETRFDADALLQEQRLKETLDRDSDTYMVTARQQLSVLTTVGVRYENQRDRFPLSPVRDTNSYRVMPGVEFTPRALIRGSAWVGYRSFTPANPILSSQEGLVSQLALTYTLLGATTFGVTYDRDYEFSYEALTPYFVDNSVGVFVRRALGRQVDVLASVARHRYSYEPLAVEHIDVGALLDRIDTTDIVGVSLGYSLKGETRVGFGLSYSARHSTTRALRDYDRLRIGTTVAYGF